MKNKAYRGIWLTGPLHEPTFDLVNAIFFVTLLLCTLCAINIGFGAACGRLRFERLESKAAGLVSWFTDAVRNSAMVMLRMESRLAGGGTKGAGGSEGGGEGGGGAKLLALGVEVVEVWASTVKGGNACA